MFLLGYGDTFTASMFDSDGRKMLMARMVCLE